MDNLKKCIHSLGLQLVDRRLKSINAESIRREISCVHSITKECKKKVFIYEDPGDIRLILENHSTLGKTKKVEYDLIFIWDKIFYFMLKGDETKSIKDWEMFFTKGISSDCSICLERVGDETDAVVCKKCHEIRCRVCDDLQVLSECPVCRTFEMDSYVRKRAFYLSHLLDRAKISHQDFLVKGRKGCESILCKTFTSSSVEDLIDETMGFNGKKVYDVRGKYPPVMETMEKAVLFEMANKSM